MGDRHAAPGTWLPVRKGDGTEVVHKGGKESGFGAPSRETEPHDRTDGADDVIYASPTQAPVASAIGTAWNEDQPVHQVRRIK